MQRKLAYFYSMILIGLMYSDVFGSVEANQLRQQSPTAFCKTKSICNELGQSLATATLCYVLAGYIYVYIIKRIQAGYKNIEELEELHLLAKKAQELQQAGCVVNFPIPVVGVTRFDEVKNELLDTFVFPAHVAWANFWVKQLKNDRMFFIF